jgi:hypothetical protein
MEMKNRDLVMNLNMLNAVVDIERAYEKTHNEKLFQGRIKVSYGIKKNLDLLTTLLKPYEAARKDIINEFRNTEAENEQLKSKQNEENELAKEEGRTPNQVNIPIILKEGKDEAAYLKALDELLDIDVPDVNIYKINIESLDGLPLNSDEVGLLMFMLE